MSFTRRQIGAAWSYGVNASATTIPLPARTIQRGSLVKAVFRYEATNTALTVTDSAGGVWRVERHFQTNINTVVAWCWNHPGGASVVITGTLAAAQGYRYAFAWEETGGDVTDPAIPESIIKTHGTASAGMSHWVGSDPLADTTHVSGAYSGATWTPGGGQTVVGTNQYLYLTAIRGVNVNRRFARHSASGAGTSIAHISIAFRAPDAEYVALAKRRIWIPVSTGGGGTSYSLTADVGSYTITGQDAGFTYAPGAASYTLTADAGSYSMTGQDAGLSYAPGSGAYSLTAEFGTYILTGVDASVSAGRNLSAEFGAYTLTGQDAGVSVGRRIAGEFGSYSLTGQDATLTAVGAASYSLTAEVGLYSIDGQSATLIGPETKPEIELLGGGPGLPKKRKQIEKGSYLERLLSPPLVDRLERIKPEAAEVIEEIAEEVVQQQEPVTVAVQALRRDLKAEGIAYREAYQEVLKQLVSEMRQAQEEEDEELTAVLAAVF